MCDERVSLLNGHALWSIDKFIKWIKYIIINKNVRTECN